MTDRPLLAVIAVLGLFCIGSTAIAAEAQALVMVGNKLAANEAETLEARIEQNPRDVVSRTKLLGYYFGKGFRDQSAREAKRRHVLWLIQNSPEAEVLSLPYGQLNAILDAEAYSQGKTAWIGQLKKQPDRLTLLENSSNYFLLDDRELAIESLKKARSLDADNPKWPAALGQLYLLNMMTTSEKAKGQAAENALEQLEIAYELSTDEAHDALLASLAKAALAAGEPEKAKGYAEQMLSQNVGGWNHGNNVHHGNLILGKLALATDDFAEAKERLIEAGKTPGSPQLNSFGPNMALARELLQKGEKDAVLEYFALCSKFWKSGEAQLATWSAVVKDDKMPDFGPNLNY